MTKQTENIKVDVTYPDGKGAHTTTIAEIKQRFKGETKQWLTRFIDDIINKGVAYTNFGGKYTKIS